jgi:RNA polymerase sigma factor (sigma-70 family)
MANTQLDDTALIAGIRGTTAQRDVALRTFFSDLELRSIVLNIIRQNGGQDADGEDAFQDTMILFERNIREGRFEGKSSLRTYFIGIAKWQWHNRQRQHRTVEWQPTEHDQTIPSVEVEVLSEERKGLIEQALTQIGERCKAILMLYKQSYSNEEIAQTFELSSPDMAKKESYRCRIRLKEYIQSQPHLFELFKSMI